MTNETTPVDVQPVRPRVLIFSSGDAEVCNPNLGDLIEFSRTTPEILSADIVGLVSDHAHGGTSKKAQDLDIPFHYMYQRTVGDYQALIDHFRADYAVLLDWFRPVRGLDPKRTIRIHPGPVPLFGGEGMQGHRVHEAVLAASHRGEVQQSAVSMNFVIEECGQGPVFFELPVPIRPNDTPEVLANRANERVRSWAAFVLDCVLQRGIELHDSGRALFKGDTPVFRTE